MKLSYLFTRYKNFIIIFLIFFSIFIISYFYSNKSLLIDMPVLTMAALNNQNNNIFHYIYVNDDVSRMFSYILGTLCLNIIMPFLHKPSLLDLNRLFSISYMIIPFIAIVFNFCIANRTKRYDIAILNLFVYSFFSLPSIIWTSREIQLAYMLWFALLQYFLTNQKLKFFDYIIISFLCIYSFESYELFVIIGPILFIYALLRKKSKETQNKNAKIIIGFSSLIATIHIFLKFFTITSMKYSISFAPYRYFLECIYTLKNLLDMPLLISVIGIILLFTYLLKKNKAYTKLIYIYWLVLTVIILIDKKNIYTKEYDYCALLYVIPILIIFIILIREHLDLKIKKSNMAKFFLISLIVGCLHFTYQIKSNLEYYNHFKNIKYFLEQNSNKISYLPDHYIPIYNKFEDCIDINLKSLILQENNIQTILFPSENMNGYNSKVCHSLYFNPANNKIEIYQNQFEIKNKYWDFTNIKTSIPIKDRI